MRPQIKTHIVPLGTVRLGAPPNGARLFRKTPSGGGDGATYELGGLSMIDLRSHNILREVPFQKWSDAGHVMTRNPVRLAATGNQLTLWAAPDNGEDVNGTELFTFQASVNH